MTQNRRVWLLAAAIAAAAAALWVTTPVSDSATVPPLVPWLCLTVAFALTESYLMHVNVGRHAHSFAFSDLPLVLGLFVATPTTMLTSRLAGAAISLGLLRRQRPVKLSFNLAQLALGMVTALLVWHLGGGTDITSQRTWLVAVLALVVVAVVSSAAVTCVIWVAGSRPSMAAFGRTVGIDVATALAQSSFAVVTLSVVRIDWRGMWAVLVVAGYLALAQRAHIRLQKRHGALQRLVAVASRVTRELRTDVIAQEIVVGAAATLDGAGAELELIGDDGSAWQLRYDGTTVTASTPAAAPAAPVPPHESAQRAAPDRISAPLQAQDRVLGRLTVTGSSAVRAFGNDERDLLHALAQHAGTALTNGRLADELRASAAANEHQATHDMLTGLPNRLLFERILSAHLADGRPVAVLLLDLDRFKEVNDTLGHAAGDALLTDVGARLQAAVPGAACIARLGGDEFTVLLADADADAASRAAQAARDALLHPLQVRSVEVSVDASIGIALAPAHGTTSGDLLRLADVAMYDAKDGRGGVTVYDDSIDHNDPSRLGLVAELRDAIATGALLLHYQPKVTLADPAGSASVEALARWAHPERGFVPPDEFIAIAEQTGLITPLTDHVLALALAQCRRWLDDGLDVSVSVNISARVLRDAEFPERVAAALDAARVPASRLTLEITETAIMDDVAHTVDVLWRLRRAGLRLSIDDLGIGQSSLAYLKRLPVHEVKIDKSFVMTMADDPDDDAIVCAVVGLAHRLGMTIVAEGVETERIRDRLVEIGCDVAQGFWYSRPLPPADVSPWFAGLADLHRAPSLRRVEPPAAADGAA